MNPLAQETINNTVKSFTEVTSTEPAINPLTGTPENAKDVTQKVSGALNEYSKRGYDGLASPPPRPEVQQVLRNWVVTEIKNWKEYNDFFDSIPNAGLKAAVMKEAAESILRSPNFAANFRGNFGKLMEQSMPDIIAQAKAKSDELAAKITANGEKKTNVTTDRNNQDARIKSFDDGSTGNPKGSKITDLENARDTAAKLESQKNLYEPEVRTRQGILGDAIKAREALAAGDPGIAPADAAIATARANLETAQKKLDDYNEAVTKRDRLQAEVDNFNKNRRAEDQRLTDLNIQLADINAEGITLGNQKTAADIELAGATDKRKALEKEFQDKLTTVTAETVRGHLAQELEDAARYEEALLERKRKEAKDKPSQKVYDAIHGRWREIGTKKGRFLGLGRERQTTVYKDADLARDYKILMENGPRELMRKVLEDAAGFNPGPPPTYTDTELGALIPDMLKNDDFMKDKGQDLALNLLKQRRLSGKRMEEGDVRFMASTPWGMELAKKLITDDGQVDALLQQAKDAKMISSEFTKNDLLRVIGENKGKLTLLAIITMLLTGGITSLAPLAVMATAKTAISSSVGQAALAGGAAFVGGSIAKSFSES